METCHNGNGNGGIINGNNIVIVGQCDLDLGSSHYIRADTGLPRHSLTHSLTHS